MTACDGCGGLLLPIIKIRVMNGALHLCQQCLDDINRKNPLQAEIERLKADLAAMAAERDEHFAEIAQLRLVLVGVQAERDEAQEAARLFFGDNYGPYTDRYAEFVASWPWLKEQSLNKCKHDRLNEEGICRTCGQDCRGTH